MLIAISSLILGLIVLVWSADRFVEGAASTAKFLKIPPLLIGMVIVGFGTSAPEIVVSTLAALKGNPGIALGNAYGSNIANIALILGVTALVNPIIVRSTILRKELPILTLITFLSVILVVDLSLTRLDAAFLLIVFGFLMAWTVYQGIKEKSDSLANDVEKEIQNKSLPIKQAVTWLLIGLCLLILSSRILVFGAVEIAKMLGVSDMFIGLTIIAVGTSLPELASSVVAARKGEHDIALGNVLGSNLFNTLLVVGIAGTIHPCGIEPMTLSRDLLVMSLLTISLFVIGYGFNKRHGRINRYEATALLGAYVGYSFLLLSGQISFH